MGRMLEKTEKIIKLFIVLLFFRLCIFCYQSTLSKTDTFGTGTKCPSYRESSKGSKERQGPTLSVRFTEVSVLQRCPLRESRLFLCLFKILSYQEQALTRENEIFSLGFDTLCSQTVALILQVA